MNKNMTKFLILAIILCITVGVASATEASSDDVTAKDAPTITKNTPTTEKIITKTENKKINKNNKTTSTKKDTGDLYVSPDVTEAKTGTNEDPTTIIDAVSKVTQNGNIILLPGTTGVYTPTEQILISDDTTQADTNKFSFTAENTDIKIDASQVTNLFQINTGYDVTFNNISINNALNTPIRLTDANLTLNGEATYENNRATLISGTGNVNILGTNTFKNNVAESTVIVVLEHGDITISGENTFTDNKVDYNYDVKGGLLMLSDGKLTINGTNKFTNNNVTSGAYGSGGVIYLSKSNSTIIGTNKFTNNTLQSTYKSGGAAIYISANENNCHEIIGENIFEDNIMSGGSGGAIYYTGAEFSILNISGNNLFKNNSPCAINGTFTNLVIEGSNKFINNSATRGGAIYLGLVANGNATITGSNLFEYNSISGSNAQGSALYVVINNNVTFKTINTTYTNNYASGAGIIHIAGATSSSICKNINIIFSENKFTNNNVTGNAILRLSFNNQNTGLLTISNNTFQDNTVQNQVGDTIFYTNNLPTLIENNTFINTPIYLSDVILTSDMENQEVEPNTPITLTYTATLGRPKGYDSNIIEQLPYQLYINDQNKYNGTGNTIIISEDYNPETQGVLNIYAKVSNHTSNTITITIKKPTSSTNITTETPQLGGTTELIATFYDEEGAPVNGGKAIFRINGKTLRDAEGNVIYVNVVDGVAQQPDVNITREWTKPDTTIQAVYMGNEEETPIFTEKTTINVVKPEVNIELTIPEEATAGDKITLTASITSGELIVNTGRVVFKLNGKSLKDEDGKVLYVDVNEGIATTNYTLPTKIKAKEYNLTAVFTDNMYERGQKEATITVKSK